MSSTTRNKPTQTANRFDESLLASYAIDLASPKGNRFDLVVEVHGEDEEFMLAAFHTQSVAVEGRSAIAQLITAHFAEMADHAAYKMIETTEHINRYTEAAQLGRFQERNQVYNEQLMDNTWRHLYQANEIAARSMFEDLRRPIDRPHHPARLKRKGVVRGVKEFFMGEE